MFKKLFISGLLALSSSWSADWSKTQLEVFYGDGYQLGEEVRNTFSWTHASSNSYGGNFFFFDVEQGVEGGTLATYGEWTPKVMLSKLTGSTLDMAILKDVGLTGTLEVPSGNRITHLAGLNIALDIPGFAFLDISPFVRDNSGLPGSTYQITAAWLMPIELGGLSASFSGFLDYTGDEGDQDQGKFSSSYLHTQPALFVDVGKWMGHPQLFQLGVEYKYWKNKFGVKGINESVPQLGFRSVF